MCLYFTERIKPDSFEEHSDWVRHNKQNFELVIMGKKIPVMIVKDRKSSPENLETLYLELLDTEVLRALNHQVHHDSDLNGIGTRIPSDI